MYNVWWDTRPMSVHGAQEFASVPENKPVKLTNAIGFKEQGQGNVIETLELYGDEVYRDLETGSGPVIEISSF
jgi:hypothetical protein